MNTIDEETRDQLITGFFKLSEGENLSPEELSYSVGIWYVSMEVTQKKWKAFAKKFPLTREGAKDRPDFRKFTFMALVLFWFKEKGQLGGAKFDEVFECLEEFHYSFLKEHNWIQHHCEKAFNVLYAYPTRVPELMLRLGLEGYVRGYCQNEDSRKYCPSGAVYDRLKEIVPDLVGAPVDGLANLDLGKVRRNLSNRDKKVREFFGPEMIEWVKQLREQAFLTALTLHDLKKMDERMLKPAKSPSGLALRHAYFDSVKDRRS